MAELTRSQPTVSCTEEEDDEWLLELQSDEPSSDSTRYNGNSSFTVPISVPNVIEAVASVTQSVTVKLTYVEHKYGKTIEQLRPNFVWASTDRVKASLEASTQFYQAHQWSKRLKRHYKSRFPGANVTRVNETVCTDTAYMDHAGQADGILGHGGAKGFQLFVGHDTNTWLSTRYELTGAFLKYWKIMFEPTGLL
jgi:hypothetical protein